MIERLTAVFAALFLTVSTLPAQSEAPLVPHFPAGNLAYLVIVIHGGAAPSATVPENPRAPVLRKSVSVLRIGKIVRYQITWTNGRKTEVWQDDENHVAVAEDPVSGDLDIFPGGSGLPQLLSLQTEALDWIKGDGAESSAGGKKAIYFQRMMTFEGADGPYQEEYQAWIHPESALPLALDDSHDRYEFNFAVPPPTETQLNLPPKVLERIARYKRAREKPSHL